MVSILPGGSHGAVLVDHEISQLAEGAGLISPFEEAFLKGASYDLRLGEEYSTAGEHRTLSDGSPSCQLEPGQFILLTSHELLELPDNVIGHAGLVSRWAKRGLISLFSPQIDPGFKGLIVVPLFNGGNAPITLRFGEPMFTVEFVRTTGPVAKGWAIDHPPLLGIPSDIDVQLGRPNFSAIGDEIHELRRLISTLEARFAGFTEGTTQRYVISSTTAVWFTATITVLALAVAILTLTHG